MVLKEITKEELYEKYKDYLTVGELKEFLSKNNIPNDARVLIQRVEDVYYEKHRWGIYLKKGDNSFADINGNIVKESLEQYHPAWCCVKYNDEDDVIFINMHF